MTILEELLGPVSLQEFNEQYLFKMPFAAPFKANRFSELISWSLLEEIMNSGHADCWLPRQGLLPDSNDLSTGKLRFEQAQEKFTEGRTILVRHAEKAHPKLKEIADDFHDLFKDPIDIQLYVTPAGEEGFNWHYDAEEVFVIQSSGEKEFRLRRNTINPWPVISKLPKNMHFEMEPPSPEIRCHLKAGDWLYIPSGYWHKARAITPSFHMSVGVMATTGVSLMESIVPKLAESPFWRQRFPMKGIEGSEEMTDEMINALGNHIKSLMKEEIRRLAGPKTNQ